MIILGILAIIFGGILYFNGNNINNDLDAQMESIFNDGISNPGSTYETMGILLLVVGVVLLIIGAIMASNKNSNDESKSEIIKTDPKPIQEPKVEYATCKVCGAKLDKDSKFCMQCGKPIKVILNEGEPIVCPNCGELLPSGSKFCMYCGKDVPSFGT